MDLLVCSKCGPVFLLIYYITWNTRTILCLFSIIEMIHICTNVQFFFVLGFVLLLMVLVVFIVHFIYSCSSWIYIFFCYGHVWITGCFGSINLVVFISFFLEYIPFWFLLGIIFRFFTFLLYKSYQSFK